MKYLVNWDNGNNACGTFPFTFDTFEQADAYGRDWAIESNELDHIDPNDSESYSYEVIEIDNACVACGLQPGVVADHTGALACEECADALYHI